MPILRRFEINKAQKALINGKKRRFARIRPKRTLLLRTIPNLSEQVQINKTEFPDLREFGLLPLFLRLIFGRNRNRMNLESLVRTRIRNVDLYKCCMYKLLGNLNFWEALES